jgi:hypothetical protein
MPVSQTDATQVVEIVYGEPPRHLDPAELSAARRLLALPGMTPKKVSLLMAIVTSSRHWGPIIQTVQKLELHLEKILDLLAKDPSAPGNRPLGGADGYQADTSESAGQAAEELGRTFEQKVAAEQQPWLDLIDEAHRAGLRGPAMSRWAFQKFNERHRKNGEGPRDFDRTMAAFGVATHPRASLPSRRSAVEPHRVADASTPKPATPEDFAHAADDEEDSE